MIDPNKQKEWEEKLNDAGKRFEQEVHRVVQFFDTEVVPEVRKHGSAALRKAAIELHKIADSLEVDQRTHSDTSSKPTEPR
jgi:hypothetical protein